MTKVVVIDYNELYPKGQPVTGDIHQRLYDKMYRGRGLTLDTWGYRDGVAIPGPLGRYKEELQRSLR